MSFRRKYSTEIDFRMKCVFILSNFFLFIVCVRAAAAATVNYTFASPVSNDDVPL